MHEARHLLLIPFLVLALSGCSDIASVAKSCKAELSFDKLELKKATRVDFERWHKRGGEFGASDQDKFFTQMRVAGAGHSIETVKFFDVAGNASSMGGEMVPVAAICAVGPEACECRS